MVVSKENKKAILFEKGVSERQEKKINLNENDLKDNPEQFIKNKNIFSFSHIFNSCCSSEKSNISIFLLILLDLIQSTFDKIISPQIKKSIKGKNGTIIFIGKNNSQKNYILFNNKNSLISNIWEDFEKKKKVIELQHEDSVYSLHAKIYGIFKGKNFDFLNKTNEEQASNKSENVPDFKDIDLTENEKASLHFLKKKNWKLNKKNKKVSIKIKSKSNFENFIFEIQNAQTITDLLSEEQKGGILIIEFQFTLIDPNQNTTNKGTIRYFLILESSMLNLMKILVYS